MQLNNFKAHPIAWDGEKKGDKKDHNIGEKIAVLQLIHVDRFNAEWVEYHHPRLTRVFYNAVKSLNAPERFPYKEHRNSELATIMFSWMQ
jgi:hypothetical protein